MFNLRDAREYEGYSMSQLANKLNKSKSAYARWESEKDIIPLVHLVSLANIYQLNIDFLIGLTDKRIKVSSLRELDRNIISTNLKKVRKDQSQKSFAKEFHVVNSTISRYENQQLLISTSCLLDICKKKHISVDWFLGFSNNQMIN